MATFVLTTGTDTFPGTSGDDQFNGTVSTLTAGDSLDGDAGHDTLVLIGAGTFDLSTLALFKDIEEVDVTNVSGGASSLTLGNGADLTVIVELVLR